MHLIKKYKALCYNKLYRNKEQSSTLCKDKKKLIRQMKKNCEK